MLAFDSGNEGTTNDLIKDFDTKFAMAVDADSAAKTVHVRSYSKKNGTVVRSYKRSPAGSKESAPNADVRSSTST